MIDFVPTALQLAGVQKPKDWAGEPIPLAPGKSLVPAFAKDAKVDRDCLWWLHEGNRAVRVGDWKLVAAKNQPWELYDLRTDRAEQNNLASKMPEKAQALESEWQKQTDAFTELAAKSPTPQQGDGKRGAKGRQKTAE
jgi:arylsulfatase